MKFLGKFLLFLICLPFIALIAPVMILFIAIFVFICYFLFILASTFVATLIALLL